MRSPGSATTAPSSAPWPISSASRTARRGGRRPAIEPQPAAVLMMDLDQFKAYNDRLGHPAGDALLHAIGTAIYGAARSEDQVFRYGGDEFAMILAGVDADVASSVAHGSAPPWMG